MIDTARRWYASFTRIYCNALCLGLAAALPETLSTLLISVALARATVSTKDPYRCILRDTARLRRIAGLKTPRMSGGPRILYPRRPVFNSSLEIEPTTGYDTLTILGS